MNNVNIETLIELFHAAKFKGVKSVEVIDNVLDLNDLYREIQGLGYLDQMLENKTKIERAKYTRKSNL